MSTVILQIVYGENPETNVQNREGKLIIELLIIIVIILQYFKLGVKILISYFSTNIYIFITYML